MSYFADPSDVFSVSFAQIAPFYIAIFLASAASNYDIDSPAPSVTEMGLAAWIVTGAIVVAIYVIVVTVWEEYRRTDYIHINALWIACFTLFMLLIFLLKKETTRGKRDLALLLSWSILSLIFSAAGQAQKDRFAAYDSFLETKPICGDKIILGSFGDQYLAVSPDGDRWMIADDCKLGAKVAPRPSREFPKQWRVHFWPKFI